MKIILILLLPMNAGAVKTVMEGIPATNNAVMITTPSATVRLITNATTYNGVVPNVGIFSASNVVVGISGCAIYSTGSVTCGGTVFPGNVSTTNGNNTWTGTNTFQSSATFNGGVFGTINKSSFTFIPETVVTANTFVTAVATITISVDNVPLDIIVAGSLFNNSAQDNCWTVFIDGQFAVVNGSTMTNSQAMVCHAGAASACTNASGTYHIDKISAGSHNFSIVPATQSGTNIKFLNGATNCLNGTKVLSQFGVREAH